MEIAKPITTTLFVVLIGIMAYFLIIPVYGQSLRLNQEILQKQSEYNSKSAYYAKVYELIDSIQQRSDALAKVDNALPEGFSFAPIVYLLQKTADENSLVIVNLSLSQPPAQPMVLAKTEAGNAKPIFFSANLTGSYERLKSFIADLEKSDRLLSVNAVAFSSDTLPGPEEPQEQFPVYHFNVEMVAYAY